MTLTQLIVMTVVVGGFFISITVYAFIVFSRFLDREKEYGRQFRERHGKKPD